MSSGPSPKFQFHKSQKSFSVSQKYWINNRKQQNVMTSAGYITKHQMPKWWMKMSWLGWERTNEVWETNETKDFDFVFNSFSVDLATHFMTDRSSIYFKAMRQETKPMIQRTVRYLMYSPRTHENEKTKANKKRKRKIISRRRRWTHSVEKTKSNRKNRKNELENISVFDRIKFANDRFVFVNGERAKAKIVHEKKQRQIE